MAKLLMLTNSRNSSAEVLPSLSLLQHQVKILPAEVSVLLDAPSIDLLIVDGRRDLGAVKNLTRLLNSTGVGAPIILVTTEGGLTITKYLDLQRDINPATVEIRGGEIAIDEHSYTAKIKGRSLDLTYKEFELLKYLVQHPGRVFTRSQLLQEVWGYDYFGGTRTVDVHIRRLRAKLGPEHEALIGTVRHVGYRFNTTNNQNQGAAALSDH